MKKFVLFVVLIPGYALATDDLIGEWALDAESCAEARLIFDAEGNHSSIIVSGGHREILGVTVYRREGDLLIISHADGEQTIEIVVSEPERLVLRNRDSPFGDMTTEFVRCVVAHRLPGSAQHATKKAPTASPSGPRFQSTAPDQLLLANCCSSVEPVSAVMEDCPAVTTWVTASK